MGRKIDTICVHHSASSRDTTVGQIKRWHTVGNGWNHCGYHRIITENGAVAHTLSPNKEGYGVYGKNATSLHVCVTGNFEKEFPSPSQVKSLKEELLKLCKKFSLFSWNIYGHKEIALPNHGTLCPGKNLMDILSEIRFELMKELREEPKIERVGSTEPHAIEPKEIEREFTWWEKVKFWLEKQWIKLKQKFEKKGW